MYMKESKEVKWFRKPSVIFWVAILTMLYQSIMSSHTIRMIFALERTWYNQLYTISFSIILEMFVVIYVIRNNKKMSILFCIISVIFNLTHLFSIDDKFNYYLLIPRLSLSLIMPFAVYFVSEEIGQKRK